MKSIDVSWVPMYLDGSSGSIWRAHPSLAWPQVLGRPDLERHRFISVSDLIELLKREGITLTYGPPTA